MIGREIDLDLFAGPGGWDEGRRMAGATIPILGVELDPAACQTATMAGHGRICDDVAGHPLDFVTVRVRGLIASPPCPSFSNAGKRAGKDDMANVLSLIADYAAGREPGGYEWADDRSSLTAQPMRWAAKLRPRWIACEQVPAVLPIWEATAAHLRGLGYDTWCGNVYAEEYGVPQVRKRAILIASLAGPVFPPAPTHASHRAAKLGGFELLPPPVSMAQALGWGMTDRPYFTLASARYTGGPDREKVGGSAARKALYGERAAGRWVEPDDDRATDPAIRIDLREAAILQGFPADYPWQGNQTERYRQVSNAIPPPLAAAVLAQFVAADSVGVAA